MGNRVRSHDLPPVEKGNYYTEIAKENGNGASFAATISTARVFQTDIGRRITSDRAGRAGPVGPSHGEGRAK